MASSIQQLLRRSAPGRVQTGDLPDAPGLQPTVTAGGQYTVRPQQAGESSLTKLSKALSNINPALRDFTVGTAIRDEMLMEEGYLSYLENPEKAEKELEAAKKAQDKTKQGIRRLISKGLLSDEANPARMVGALKARASAMVLDDYRANVMAGINETTDVEEFLNERRKEFLENPALESPTVKKHALAEMSKVENEFRNTVHARQVKLEIEQGKQDYWRMGEDLITKAMTGLIPLDHPAILEWKNHDAGLFAGVNNFIYGNIKAKLLGDLTRLEVDSSGNTVPVMTPTDALSFLREVEDWELSEKGAKFANATIKQDIARFRGEIRNQAVSLNSRNKALEAEKRNKLLGGWDAKFYDEEAVGGYVSRETLRLANDDIKRTFPPSEWPEAFKLTRTSWEAINGVRKDDQAANDVYEGNAIDLGAAIQDGSDLGSVEEELRSPGILRSLKLADVTRLLEDVTKKRDFLENVWGKDDVKDLAVAREEQISGMRKTAGFGPFPGGVDNYFTNKLGKRIREDGKLGAEEGLEGLIENKTGSEAARIYFQQEQAVLFVRMFQDRLRQEYETRELDHETTPEAAYTAIRESLPALSEEVFKKWERVLKALLKNDYDVEALITPQL